MHKLVSVCFIFSTAFLLSSCGKNGPTTPPPPTVSSITVNSSSAMLFIGATETFTATMTMSDGSTKAVTSGTWSSDKPSVATVGSTTGLVTIMGSGGASISVTSNGKTGSKAIRGLPNYQGTWTGTYMVNSCTCSGDFALADFCSLIPTGTVLETNLILTQTSDAVSGTFFLGTLSATATGPIAQDGELTLTGKITSDTSSVDVIFSLQSAVQGQITGSLGQIWTDTTLSGNAQLLCTIVSVNRTSATPNESAFTKAQLLPNATPKDLLREMTTKRKR